MLDHTSPPCPSAIESEPDGYSESRLLVTVDHHAPRLVVITARGEIDKASTPRLRDFLRTFFCSAPLHVVLDLSEMPFLDSRVVDLLNEMTRHARERRSGFSVVPDRPVDDIVALGRGRCDIVAFPSIDDALSAAREWGGKFTTGP